MKNKFSLLRRSRRSHRGFTLMEMLIVLMIIALLMSFAIYHLTGVGEGAKIQKAHGDLLTFREMLLAYETQTGSLPTTEQGLQVLWNKPTTEPIPDNWRAEMDSPILDPWGHPYQFRIPGKHNPKTYDVFSLGPDGQPDTDDDIGNWKATPSTSTAQNP